MTRNYIIPRADDAGSHVEANEAIFDAARRGWLRNIGFMAPGRNIKQAIEMSREITDCDFGMHVSFTSEWLNLRFGPILQTTSAHIGEDGRCVRDARIIFSRGPVLDVLMAEARAQYDFLTQAGLRITYVDEHMGCGWIHEPDRPERRMYHLLGEFCEEKCLIWFPTRHHGGIPRTAFDTEQSLHAFLDSHEGGYLYMTHPAFDRGSIHADRLTCIEGDLPGVESGKRQIDYNRLTDHRWADIIREHGYEILRYAEAPVVNDGHIDYGRPRTRS